MALDYLVVGTSALVVILTFYVLHQASLENGTEKNYEVKKIRIENNLIEVKVADTEQKREIGLMGISNLSENEGMLFVFDQPGYHSFWMRNTLIPLEILFINEENAIIDIQEMQPCKTVSCKVYSPKEKALYAIELNENFSKTHNISVKEKIEIVN